MVEWDEILLRQRARQYMISRSRVKSEERSSVFILGMIETELVSSAVTRHGIGLPERYN